MEDFDKITVVMLEVEAVEGIRFLTEVEADVGDGAIAVTKVRKLSRVDRYEPYRACTPQEIHPRWCVCITGI